MALRIRQIVLATHDLDATVARCERELGLQVAYRDPGVGEFGLHNALLPIGDQFLEVLAPTRDGTAAGRHLARHGDSAYMLILQTDALERERARLDRLGVRIVWRSDYDDICSVHLHPKDVGAAIVSLDQATPPESWRWAGPNWQAHVSQHGAREIREVSIGAVDPAAMARRWAEVLDTAAPSGGRIAIDRGTLSFTQARADVITGFGLAAPAGPNVPRSTTICGTRFDVSTMA
jgi:catechol 2,3-dioxygenase-like lactoylglutathione lyase family enzyme